MFDIKRVVKALWNCRIINGVVISDSIRNYNANVVTEYYYCLTGNAMPNDSLEILTDYLLYRGNKTGMKSDYFTENYPYLTRKQLRTKGSREKSLEFAMNYDSQRINQAPCTRKNRLELIHALGIRKWRTSEQQNINGDKGV